MNAKWTSLVVLGTVLAVLSTQVMAQPWAGGPGQGPGFGRGQGMGMRGQGPGFMRQGLGPAGPQGGPGAWCPWGIGPGGGPGRNAPGLGQLGFGPQGARRLGLTDDQVRKIRDIIEKSRARTQEAIREVLTEEQAKQLDLMRERAGQLGRGRGGPGGQAGRRLQQGPGPDTQVGRQGRRPGVQMGPQGQGLRQPPFQGGPGAGRGLGRQGRVAPPDASVQPPLGGQGVNPEVSPNRWTPPIEQMFDRADTNNDGALTKEEIRAFHESMGPRPGRQVQ